MRLIANERLDRAPQLRANRVHPNFTQRRFFLSFFVASGYGSRNSNRDTTKARRLYLITASVSMLGYHHDLNEPVIRLWNDAPHRVGDAQHEEWKIA